MFSDKGDFDSPESPAEMVDQTSKPSKAPPRSGGRRTHRACDRCRVKKSKCNGQQPCNTCKANERTCVFSALRRRDIRKWHCHMQDTVDEAIQRLYRACKNSSSFPGILPAEKDGYVTTESILQAMGFTNLDLGPRVGGLPSTGPLQVLPNGVHYVNRPVDHHSLHKAQRHAEHQPYNQGNSDTASVDSQMSDTSPVHPAVEFAMSPYPHGKYHHHAPTVPFPVPEHVQEHRHAHAMSQGLQYYHHHHHQHPVPTSVAQPMHLSSNEPSIYNAHTSMPPTATSSYPRQTIPYEYGDQYSGHHYLFPDGGQFINPQYVWPSQTEIVTGAQ